MHQCLLMALRSNDGGDNCILVLQGPLLDASPQISWYNWGQFQTYGQLWRDAITHLNDGRFVYLNVYNMSLARGDGHYLPNGPPRPDCLHTCLPGIVDSWNFILASFWMSCPVREQR